MLKKFAIALYLLVCGLSANAESAEPFKFFALGDMPYTIPADYSRFERLISTINHLKPNFSIFIGDTKSGSTECSDAYNLKIKSYFNQFASPLIYSIGDNEWTDCHRLAAGEYDPLERLATLRNVFFNTSNSLGMKSQKLTRQADVDPKYKLYVENSYWVTNQILFVNLHIPGSNNNFERDERSRSEYRDRNEANIAWIKQAFNLATVKQYKAIVFAFQADIFFSPNQFTEVTSGYRDTLQTLSSGAEAFKRQVLLIHGDSHKLIIDQPLKTRDQQFVLENVLRLQVMGAEQVQAIEINVNPSADQPFGFTPLLIPLNRIHPSP